MKRVLITGASGFIGKALCRRMLSDGWQVRGVFRSRHKNAICAIGIEAVEIESTDRDTDWSDILKGVDILVHLAARVHVLKENAADPLSEFRRVNVAGTETLARKAAVAGVHRFVFLSSIGVNGLQTTERSFTEKDIPQPHDFYAQSKLEAEQIIHRITTGSEMEAVIIRSPLVYGPCNPGNILRLFNLIAKGWPLPLALTANRRSLIYLENLTDAIVTCINHPKAAGQIYFVADGEDVSTPELIRRIASAIRKPVTLFPFPMLLLKTAGRISGKSAAVERLVGSLTVDTAKIRNELNWKPPYTMEQGLFETAKWYKKRGREVQSTDYADYTD
ncbi:MAG: SDR family oxidoreductase [Deltaproteobacteria bacterium]|nr:SDR family oxidoreductase [Deltaproteobacteria bacterium]